MTIRKVLILAANPLETARLRLDKETEEIRTTLQLSPNRDRFEIESRGALRPQDLQTHLYNLKPQILHFSGHGGGERGLAFEDENGMVKAVPSEALANTFKLFAKDLQCVVLNACYAVVQAEAICQHIPYAIGMNQAIGDEAARKFAEGFYRAIWDDRTIEEAFDSGVSAIALEGIPEELTPVLMKRSQLFPSEVLPPVSIDAPITNSIDDVKGNISQPKPMSKAQQLKLQYQQKTLAELENKVQKVQSELDAVLPSDILTREALENRLNLLFEQMTQVEQEIQKLEQEHG
jgi:hypothetical protein